jgi:hypothetical protein
MARATSSLPVPLSPVDQHRYVLRGDPTNGLVHLAHGRAGADDGSLHVGVRGVDPSLKAVIHLSWFTSDEKLRASLALLPVDASQVEYPYGRLLEARPQEIYILCDSLVPYKKDLIDKLWTIVEQPAKGKEEQRMRAACALASYDPNSIRWAKTAEPIVNHLVAVVSPPELERWMDALRPVRAKLEHLLRAVHGNTSRSLIERTRANYILANYGLFRLPTAAEMEFATRAGGVTSPYFGDAEELLPENMRGRR